MTKLLLKPGAVYKLKTGTQLSYATEKRNLPASATIELSLEPDLKKPARTTITHKPVEALVTWHLHTANGTAWDVKAKKRSWPAKGGWSGILTTAPVKVTLTE